MIFTGSSAPGRVPGAYTTAEIFRSLSSSTAVERSIRFTRKSGLFSRYPSSGVSFPAYATSYRKCEYFESDAGSYMDVSPTMRNDEKSAMKTWSRTASRIVFSEKRPRNSFFAMIVTCLAFIGSTPG